MIQTNSSLCSQIYGDNENIFGYRGLKISLYMSSSSLRSFIHVQFKEKVCSNPNVWLNENHPINHKPITGRWTPWKQMAWLPTTWPRRWWRFSPPTASQCTRRTSSPLLTRKRNLTSRLQERRYSFQVIPVALWWYSVDESLSYSKLIQLTSFLVDGMNGGQREFEIFLASEASPGLREFHERIQVQFFLKV